MREYLDLNGRWSFATDADAKGEEEAWFDPGFEFEDAIDVPGVWQAHGVGAAAGMLRCDYQGRAWYRKRIRLPDHWSDRRILWHLGGVWRRSRAYVNGKTVGESESITAPIHFDVTHSVRFGAENALTLCISNLPRSGRPYPPHVLPGDADAPLDEPIGALHCHGNWGGIYDAVWLEALHPVSIASLKVFSDCRPSVRAAVTLNASTAEHLPLDVSLEVRDQQGECLASIRSDWQAADGEAQSIALSVPQAQLWSPESPCLYDLVCTLSTNHKPVDSYRRRIGFRTIEADNGRLRLNGQPYYLRGFSFARADAISGMLPWQTSVWVDRFRAAKRYGFNHVRCHSTVLPRAAFEAADSTGILVQSELLVACTAYFMPNRQFLSRELSRIIDAFADHPSFFSLSFGNEFNLERDFENDKQRLEFLTAIEECYGQAKAQRPDVFVMSNTGYEVYPSDMVALYKGLAGDRPSVEHESGGYRASLPDLGLVERFDGVLRADPLAHKRQWIRDHGLEHAHDRLRAHSELLQQEAIKWYLERTRSIDGCDGYQWWVMADSPHNSVGDSLDEGILNYFWDDSKANSSQEIRTSNAETVILLTADVNDRAFPVAEGKRTGVIVSHFGSQTIEGATLAWTLVDTSDDQWAHGSFEAPRVQNGACTYIGGLSIPALECGAETLSLHMELRKGAKKLAENCWRMWSMPSPCPANDPTRGRRVSLDLGTFVLAPLYSGFVSREALWSRPSVDAAVTCNMDWAAYKYLLEGGRLLWFLDRDRVDEEVAVDFFPPLGHAMGTQVETHPALNGFPHQGFCDLQFYNLIEGGIALPIPEAGNWWTLAVDRQTYGESFAARKPENRLEPIVWALRLIPGVTWAKAEKRYQRVAWLFEARVGQGPLLVCTLQVLQHVGTRVEASTLFDSLLRYLLSGEFRPSGAIGADELSGLLSPYLH